MRTTVDGEGTEWDSELTIEGAVDFKNEFLYFVMDDETLGLGEIEAIVADGTIYIGAGTLRDLFEGFAGAPDMPEWLSTDLGDYSSELLAAGQPWTNPGQVFAFLTTSAASVSEEGTEDVRGTSTTHYRMVIDTEAAMREGLPRDVAENFVHRTIRGAGHLLTETGKSPARLRHEVTSPGGTTAAAMHILEERGFRALVEDAVRAAAERARELGSAD